MTTKLRTFKRIVKSPVAFPFNLKDVLRVMVPVKLYGAIYLKPTARNAQGSPGEFYSDSEELRSIKRTLKVLTGRVQSSEGKK